MVDRSVLLATMEELREATHIPFEFRQLDGEFQLGYLTQSGEFMKVSGKVDDTTLFEVVLSILRLQTCKLSSTKDSRYLPAKVRNGGMMFVC
jgi:hypothetical protein